MDMVAEQKEKVGMRRVREVAIRHEGGELAFRYGNMERLEAKTRPIFFFIYSASVKQQRNLTIPEKECDD